MSRGRKLQVAADAGATVAGVLTDPAKAVATVQAVLRAVGASSDLARIEVNRPSAVGELARVDVWAHGGHVTSTQPVEPVDHGAASHEAWERATGSTCPVCRVLEVSE